MCNVQHKPFPVVRGFFGCPTKSPDSLGKIPCCKKNTNTTARWASARVGLIRHAKPFKGESLPFAGIEPLTTQILKTCLQYIQAAIQVHWPSFHVKTIIIKDLLHRQVKEYNQTPVVAFNVSGQQHQFQIRNVTSEAYPMNQFSFLGFCLIFHHNWTKNHWGAIFTIHNWCNFSIITAVGKPIITVMFTTSTENADRLLLLSNLGILLLSFLFFFIFVMPLLLLIFVAFNFFPLPLPLTFQFLRRIHLRKFLDFQLSGTSGTGRLSG